MNYSTLASTIADYAHRSDLDSVIPVFIELAEERMNRALRVRDMEMALASTAIVDNRITLAADVADVKTIWRPGFEGIPLDPSSFEVVLSGGTRGEPTMYAMQGGDLYFNGTGDVQGVLYRKIPALTSGSPTNWLADKHPSLYLFGALAECDVYIGNDPALYETRFQSALSEVNGNDGRRFGKLVARAK